MGLIGLGIVVIAMDAITQLPISPISRKAGLNQFESAFIGERLNFKLSPSILSPPSELQIPRDH